MHPALIAGGVLMILAGIVGAVIAFGIAATFLIGIPAHLAGIEQGQVAEADRADALVERCETLRLRN
ncbi:hypothetical protein MUN76_05790 [Leucobacter rhizosphaerae]|uniref:Uncharacterized protein n=1 Tax=Leucobacter rhizosphaerae TaxID=2932245 RepID=A0ABY4FYY3_9MICO|nr:hypothetical protein [Leucobacter rhizosphaerae]UOQ61480.1 hypothetical protein MUN76_05790 [Leucobacter rhizosphaerae]